MIQGSTQFGRYVEVEIRDFQSNVKTIIGNEFEIEFDYFKTLDQTTQDDSGKVKIYGLTPERVKALQTEGGEIELRCGYLNSSIEVLFIASIERLYYDIVDNITVTTIECSANLMNYYYSASITSENQGKTALDIFLLSYARKMGASGIEFHINAVPEVHREDVKEFLKTCEISLSQVGSIESILRALADILGFAIKIVDSKDSKILSFTLTDVGVKKILGQISNGYPKTKALSNSDKDSNIFFRTLEASKSSREITVLDFKTGLISAKTEYKIAYANADQLLNPNEEETNSSIEKRNSALSKDKAREIKEAAKKAKALREGRNYKEPNTKEKKSIGIQVNRRYNRVKAFLNPLIRPQSAVAVIDSEPLNFDRDTAKEDGFSDFFQSDVIYQYIVYRVRNVTYKGNNKKNDWIMDLYCEDTEANTITPEEAAKFLSTTSSESLEFISEDADLSQYEE